MHEVGVMTSILEAILDELRGHKVQKVEEVLLVIGDLTYLGEDQLRFAFDILTQGTVLEGSELVVEHEGVEVRCPACGYQGEAEYYQDELHCSNIPTLNCPECGSRVEVERGKSCMVRSIRVVEEDVPA